MTERSFPGRLGRPRQRSLRDGDRRAAEEETAGRVGPRFHSSSHPPRHQSRGRLPAAPARSRAVLSPRGWPAGLCSAPSTGPILRGAVIGGRGSGDAGERAHARPRALREPLPEPVPPVWVGVRLRGPAFVPLAEPVCVSTPVSGTRSCVGMRPRPAPQFLRVAHEGPVLTEAGLGLGLASRSASFGNASAYLPSRSIFRWS